LVARIDYRLRAHGELVAVASEAQMHPDLTLAAAGKTKAVVYRAL
jgi:hypothetical protein